MGVQMFTLINHHLLISRVHKNQCIVDVDAGPGGQRDREYERCHRQSEAAQETTNGTIAINRYRAESYYRFVL